MEKDSSVWKDKNGKAISCPEKLEILQENLTEIIHVYLQGKEEAILFGVSVESFEENTLYAIKNSK
jgi:hypothetical protein